MRMKRQEYQNMVSFSRIIKGSMGYNPYNSTNLKIPMCQNHQLQFFYLKNVYIILSYFLFYLTNKIINCNTPNSMAIPMVLSGSNSILGNIELLIKANLTDSLVLSNHGSHIDYMTGMFMGNIINS